MYIKWCGFAKSDTNLGQGDFQYVLSDLAEQMKAQSGHSIVDIAIPRFMLDWPSTTLVDLLYIQTLGGPSLLHYILLMTPPVEILQNSKFEDWNQVRMNYAGVLYNQGANIQGILHHSIFSHLCKMVVSMHFTHPTRRHNMMQSHWKQWCTPLFSFFDDKNYQYTTSDAFVFVVCFTPTRRVTMEPITWSPRLLQLVDAIQLLEAEWVVYDQINKSQMLEEARLWIEDSASSL
jgi:hypothetical protein